MTTEKTGTESPQTAALSGAATSEDQAKGSLSSPGETGKGREFSTRADGARVTGDGSRGSGIGGRGSGDGSRVTGDGCRPTLSLALDAPSHFRSVGVKAKDWPWHLDHHGDALAANRWVVAFYVVAEMLRRSDSALTVLQVIDAVLSAPDKEAPGVMVVSEEWAANEFRQRCQAEDALSKAEAAASGYYEDLLCLFNRLDIAPPASPEEHAAAMAAVKSALSGHALSMRLEKDAMALCEWHGWTGELNPDTCAVEVCLERLCGLLGRPFQKPSPPAPSPSARSSQGEGLPSDDYAQCCRDYPGWQTLVRADVLYAFGLVERNVIGRFTLEALQSNVKLRHAMVIPICVLKEFARREGWLLVPGEAVTFVERPEPSPEPGLPCGPDRGTHDKPEAEGVACVDALYVPDRSNLGLHPADATEQVAGRDL